MRNIITVMAAVIAAAIIMTGCGEADKPTPDDTVCEITNYTSETPEAMIPLFRGAEFINFEIQSDDVGYEIGYAIIENGVRTDTVLYEYIPRDATSTVGEYSFFTTGNLSSGGKAKLNYAQIFYDTGGNTSALGELDLELPELFGFSPVRREEGFKGALYKGEELILADYTGPIDEESDWHSVGLEEFDEYGTIDEAMKGSEMLSQNMFHLIFYISAVQADRIDGYLSWPDEKYSTDVVADWDEFELEELPLVAAIPEEDVWLYGVKSDAGGSDSAVILKHGNVKSAIHTIYLTPRFILPKMAFDDFDGDGEKEIAIDFYTNSGTGVEIEDLCVVETSGNERQESWCPLYSDEETIISGGIRTVEGKRYFETSLAGGEKYAINVQVYEDNGNHVQDYLEYGDIVSYKFDGNKIIRGLEIGFDGENLGSAVYFGKLVSEVGYIDDGDVTTFELSNHEIVIDDVWQENFSIIN